MLQTHRDANMQKGKEQPVAQRIAELFGQLQRRDLQAKIYRLHDSQPATQCMMHVVSELPH